ncbi:VOC family protein [Crossiella sp. CA198]|uniref:VOC family protein n=1 Tax=Crossiella sp. CA198 TaxID=3455607 RepID=UPI003F8D6D65
MPERDGYTAGTPSWVDVSTPDLDAAKEFYAALFGWTYTPGEEKYGYYVNALVRDRIVAGLGPAQPDAPPMWGSYLHTEDAEGAVARARSAGGTIVVEPMTVGSFGTMAIALDPAGALIGFWQPDEHHGAGLVNEHGTLVWNELRTTAVDAAKSFYGSIFDYDYSEVRGAPEYPVFELAGQQVASAEPVHREEERPHWLVYFGTSDVDATVAAARELGGAVVEEITETAYGRMAVLADPWGAVFAVLHLGE